MSDVIERVRHLMADQAAERAAQDAPEGKRLTVILVEAKDGWHLRFGEYDAAFGPEPFHIAEGIALRAMRRFRDTGEVIFD